MPSLPGIFRLLNSPSLSISQLHPQRLICQFHRVLPNNPRIFTLDHMSNNVSLDKGAPCLIQFRENHILDCNLQSGNQPTFDIPLKFYKTLCTWTIVIIKICAADRITSVSRLHLSHREVQSSSNVRDVQSQLSPDKSPARTGLSASQSTAEMKSETLFWDPELELH